MGLVRGARHVWLLLLFLVPFYAVLAVAFGSVDPIFSSARPEWNPPQWDITSFSEVLDGVFGGDLAACSSARCLRRGRPLRCASHRLPGRVLRGPLRPAAGGVAARLILVPFWISYLMRMLAWVNLLQDDGYVNASLVWLHVLDEPGNWLDGDWPTVVLGLVYGYVPFFILPLYAALDRIDGRLLEASRDLGASRGRRSCASRCRCRFRGCGAAMSSPRCRCSATTTPTSYLSGVAAHRDDRQPDRVLPARQPSQPTGRRVAGADPLGVLMVLMAYYLVTTHRASRRCGER